MRTKFNILILIACFFYSCSEKVFNKVVSRHEDGSRKMVLKILSRGKNDAIILNKTQYDRNGQINFVQNRNKSNQLNGLQLDSIYLPEEQRFIELKTIYKNDSKILESTHLGTASFKKAYKYSFGEPDDGLHLEYEIVRHNDLEYKRVLYITPYIGGKKHGVQKKFARCKSHFRCNDRYIKNIYWIDGEIVSNVNNFLKLFNKS